MEIIFYNNRSSKETLNKTITETFRISGTLREASSVIDPVIEIAADGSITKSCNYAYIPQFGRYYFINDIVSVKNNLWRISMHVDVLMSFNGDIKNTSGIVARQEFLYNPMLVDNKYPVSNNADVYAYTFNANAFGKSNYVVAIAEGVVSK